MIPFFPSEQSGNRPQRRHRGHNRIDQHRQQKKNVHFQDELDDQAAQPLRDLPGKDEKSIEFKIEPQQQFGLDDHAQDDLVPKTLTYSAQEPQTLERNNSKLVDKQQSANLCFWNPQRLQAIFDEDQPQLSAVPEKSDDEQMSMLWTEHVASERSFTVVRRKERYDEPQIESREQMDIGTGDSGYYENRGDQMPSERFDQLMTPPPFDQEERGHYLRKMELGRKFLEKQNNQRQHEVSMASVSPNRSKVINQPFGQNRHLIGDQSFEFSDERDGVNRHFVDTDIHMDGMTMADVVNEWKSRPGHSRANLSQNVSFGGDSRFMDQVGAAGMDVE